MKCDLYQFSGDELNHKAFHEVQCDPVSKLVLLCIRMIWTDTFTESVLTHFLLKTTNVRNERTLIFNTRQWTVKTQFSTVYIRRNYNPF